MARLTDGFFRLTAPIGIAVFALVLLVGLWGSLIAEVAHDRAAQMRSGEIQAANLARTFEEHVRRASANIDQVLLHLRDEISTEGRGVARQGELLRRSLPPDMVIQLAVIDSGGRLRYSDLGTAESLDFTDREYFRVQRDSTSDRLFISKPVLGRVSKRWSIQFTRRLTRSDGVFEGVLLFSAEPAYFVNLYDSLDIGENGAVELVGADQVVRASGARKPDVAQAAGTHSSENYFAAERPDSEVFVTPCPVDNGSRITAYRRLTDLGLAVVVHLCNNEVLTAANQRAGLLFFGGGVVSVLLLGCFAVIIWLLVRRQRDGVSLTAQTLRLQRSNCELEAFAYAISHDLREPLRTVNSFLGLLVRRAGTKLNDEEREFINFARDGALRMDHLINGLLDYSRIGRSERPFESVPLANVAEITLANLHATIDATQAVVSVMPNLPTVMGDGDELIRLFQNLIGNALKYHSPDRAPVISIAWRQQGAEWIISLMDNGIGIPADQYERIFGIFQRLHGRGEFEGTGIGLALCRKIVEHHHGRIWVTSSEGQGSTFFVALPVIKGLSTG